MLYAQVVFGLPVRGPFDYIVPADCLHTIKVGSRVWTSFRNARLVGYVVGLSRKTGITNLKEISSVIDGEPLLSQRMLKLLKELSDYYCCSWGEAIEAALPRKLRMGRVLPGTCGKLESRECPIPQRKPKGSPDSSSALLIHDLDGHKRWPLYITHIKEALDSGKSSIILVPDAHALLRTADFLNSSLHLDPLVLHRDQQDELAQWQKIKKRGPHVIVGLRSAVFAPVDDLGLIIIDEEEDSVYKQDQTPHYHAREVAFMRARIDEARLILASCAPSLESMYLAKTHKIGYEFIPREKEFPQISIIDTPHRKRARPEAMIFSALLQDAVVSVLGAQGKVLLFLNRSGFATSATCHQCGFIAQCPRCAVNLVYHFKERILRCHYCNFSIPAPHICPKCNAGYIRYAGLGTEKIESELARLFPQARIERLDKSHSVEVKNADIFIATSAIMKEPDVSFDLVGALGIDHALHRVDFRAGEKVFALLAGLLSLTRKRLIIETRLARHHILRSLTGKDMDIFYAEELRQRKDLRFPPFRHFACLKVRSKVELKAQKNAEALYEELKHLNKNKRIKFLSVNPAYPSKLRGNFYWQVMVASDKAETLSKFLKLNLKRFSHSGIIVTVDVDPV